MKEKRKPVEFNADEVIQSLKDYCLHNGYDANKIDRYQRSWNIFAALKSKGVEPHGLTNDMETLPDIVLYCDENGVIHETEHTKKIIKGG